MTLTTTVCSCGISSRKELIKKLARIWGTSEADAGRRYAEAETNGKVRTDCGFIRITED